jgi:SAM-dependent methyltransferase
MAEANKGPSKVSSFIKGSSILVLSNVCLKAINFFLLPLYTHNLTPEMIAGAERAAGEAGVKADFQIMDAEHPDFADETFDLVISRNLTWTLPNPGKAYEEWLRVLKKGGILLNFDAEYAKEDHAQQVGCELGTGLNCDMIQECRRIYDLLAISRLTRPEWDRQMLQSLGAKSIETDLEVGLRVYPEERRFRQEFPFFSIRAVR